MKTIKDKIIKKSLYRSFCYCLGRISPKTLCSILYYKTFGKKLNWKNPTTFNEWVCWLEFNSDTSLWTVLADKYKMRQWVESKGFGEYLPKLYGVYYNAKDIDFDKLPQKFVLKPNNGCGQVIIVKDKNKIDKAKTIKTADKWLKTTYGYTSAEPHYIKIPKCIIAEELLEDTTKSSLIDYKWFCFNGKPKLAQVLSNRDMSIAHSFRYQIYDTEWNPYDKYLNKKELKNNVDRPKLLEEQLNLCRILSMGFPQIRIDLYEVNNKIYIGELTLTNSAGRDCEFTNNCLTILGSYIKKDIIKHK